MNGKLSQMLSTLINAIVFTTNMGTHRIPVYEHFVTEIFRLLTASIKNIWKTKSTFSSVSSVD